MVKQTAKCVSVALLSILLAGCPDGIGKNLHLAASSPVANPTNLVARESGGFDVQLTWSDNAVGESGYRLEISHAGFTGSPPEFRILPANTSSWTYAAIPNTPYFFRVFAVTDTQESDPSNEAAATTPKVFDPPGAVTAVSEAPTQAVVSWNNVRGESGYTIEVSINGGTTWSIAAVGGVDQVGALIPGLTADTEYLFRVLTVYPYGPGIPSDPVGIVTLTSSASVRALTYPDLGIGLSYVRSSTGVDYISCFDAGSSSVAFITQLGYMPGSTIWSVGLIDPGPTRTEDVGGDGTSIVFDGAGKAHILAHDRTNNTLRWTTNAAGSWAATTVDIGPGGAKPRIAWDPATGALHAVCQYSSNQLKHLVKAPGQPWGSGEILDIQIDSASSHALAVDSLGSVHVALFNSEKELVHALKGPEPGVWSFQVLPLSPSTITPDSVSLALDATQTPHFAIHDALSGSLHHLTKVMGLWTMEIVDQTPGADVGGGPSLAIHPTTGRLHVAYYDATHGDLRYARKDTNTGWTRRLIDAVGDVGTNAAIHVSAAGEVSIACRDETQRIVKLARGAP